MRRPLILCLSANICATIRGSAVVVPLWMRVGVLGGFSWSQASIDLIFFHRIVSETLWSLSDVQKVFHLLLLKSLILKSMDSLILFILLLRAGFRSVFYMRSSSLFSLMSFTI